MKTGLKESNLVIDAQVNRVLGSCRCYHCLPFQQLLESIALSQATLILLSDTKRFRRIERRQTGYLYLDIDYE